MQPPALSTSARTHTHPLAVISLIASIIGLTVVPLIGSLVGVVLGHISHHEIQTQPERYIGNGWAVGGIVLGWLGIVLPAATAVVSAAVWLFFFGGFAALVLWLGIQ